MLLWSIQDTQKDKQLCRYVLSQKFFYCVTPMSHSKTGRNYVSKCRKKIMQMPGEVPVEQSISSTPS